MPWPGPISRRSSPRSMPFSTHGKKRLLIVLRERPDRHSQWSSDSLFPASDSHQVSGFIQAIHQHVEINKSAVRLPLLKDPLSPNCIERLPQLKPTGKTVARALIIHREDMASPHASQQGVLRRPAPDSSKLHQARRRSSSSLSRASSSRSTRPYTMARL